jgi:hypothetical protein
MSEKEIKGVVEKVYLPNALVVQGETFSLFGGLPDVSVGDSVSFEYTTKDKNNKYGVPTRYNNIVSKSLIVTRKPRDITAQYEPKKNGGEWRTPAQIIRTDSLKCAVEFYASLKDSLKIQNPDQFSMEGAVLVLAEKFEKWVVGE